MPDAKYLQAAGPPCHSPIPSVIRGVPERTPCSEPCACVRFGRLQGTSAGWGAHLWSTRPNHANPACAVQRLLQGTPSGRGVVPHPPPRDAERATRQPSQSKTDLLPPRPSHGCGTTPSSPKHEQFSASGHRAAAGSNRGIEAFTAALTHVAPANYCICHVRRLVSHRTCTGQAWYVASLWVPYASVECMLQQAAHYRTLDPVVLYA